MDSNAYALLSQLEGIARCIGSFEPSVFLRKAWAKWWILLDEDERACITSIPNFTRDKFMPITGIDVCAPLETIIETVGDDNE